MKPVLINSKLPLDVLGKVPALSSLVFHLPWALTQLWSCPDAAQVWDLSDIDKDGHLDKDEFAVVSFPSVARSRRGALHSGLSTSLLACALCLLSGHAPGVPSPGEGAGPRPAPGVAGPSVQEEEEPGLSGRGAPRPACQPSAAQGLSALDAVPRQHELAQQRWEPVAQAFAQERAGNVAEEAELFQLARL